MGTFIVILCVVSFSALIAWRWVEGIDYMNKNHPDYKGEDFLNWEEPKEKNKDKK